MVGDTEMGPPGERVNPEILKYKGKIGKADGSLIPLKKRTSDGKELLIAARLHTVPEEGKNESIDMGWKWHDELYRGEMDPDTLALIDVYVRGGGRRSYSHRAYGLVGAKMEKVH